MKTSKTELCARMNKEWEDCKAFLENHRQDDGTISAEDKAIYDEMDISVEDIAEILGFCDAPYLCRTYKLLTGKTFSDR